MKSASKSCQIVLSGSHSSKKIAANLCICINEEIHRNSISKYHILLCAQQPQPFHHLCPLHNAEGRKTTAFVGGVRGSGWATVATLRMLRGLNGMPVFFQSFPIFCWSYSHTTCVFFTSFPGLYSAICWMFWSLGCI